MTLTRAFQQCGEGERLTERGPIDTIWKKDVKTLYIAQFTFVRHFAVKASREME